MVLSQAVSTSRPSHTRAYFAFGSDHRAGGCVSLLLSDLGHTLTETVPMLTDGCSDTRRAHARTVFIAEDPDKKTVVVAHQGTDPHKVLSIANDVQFTQVAANKTLFPQAAKGVQLHSGFQDTQGRTADVVLATVKSALKKSGYKKVLVTGHSLGAAVASLDAAMLRMALPKNVAVSAVVFGLPRVGNSDWATLLNKLVRVPHDTSSPAGARAGEAVLTTVCRSRTSRTSRTRTTPCRTCRRTSSTSSTPRARCTSPR